ncbi:group 3 secretory phospholipase A2 isoform X1 [Elgaria multicarinata webbii]|uniref:group 3 secretory phospholipase A2 isoform X1 n=1 Tax=Elgaria multicarinata webbii TaxID=159646 RepID=UPI002FCD27AC
MPGTVWCGAGDSAGNFSHLGVFQGPDVCCREHDQCSIFITALAYKYGIRNLRLHTISHCDCDARFRECLRNLNNTMANFVGTTYFNVFQIPCFELKEGEDCVEWNWWGMCNKYAPMPVAHLVEASPYESISPPTPAPQPGTRSSQDRKHNQKKQKQMGQAHLSRAGRMHHLAASRSCRCYQRLDQCPYKIGPHEVKYQLHNTDSRTLFHCNCTRRLARFLRRTRGPNEVEGEVLSDYVSASCFVLQAPPGCMEGEEEQSK